MAKHKHGRLTTGGLVEVYGYWGYHSIYTVADWVYEVDNGDTRQGYWDWVARKIRLQGRPSNKSGEMLPRK